MTDKGEVGYYQDQIKSIQQTFAKFDEAGTGRILVDRVPELLKELGRDPETGLRVQQLLRERDIDNGDTCTFEEAVQHLKNVEVQEYAGPGADQGGDKTVTPLTLMRRLDEYRKQCEEKGEYVEAKKARMKYEELRQKEEIRQRRLVEQAQIHEMNEVEQAQKQQFLEFSAAWDRYMADYESTAYMSVERLREQHAQDFAEFQEQLRKQPPGCKQSKELLELRRKQQALAKLGRYKEANEVKKQGDDLEKWEQAKNSSEVHDRTRRQEERLRAAQQKALAALLKRIQRDRGEQIRHRQMDSQRLIQRNKNLKANKFEQPHSYRGVCRSIAD
uniref:EF-hand domain-containing protein n=1 Tax=Oxyrrhis marina TaxID=2969 RepID=A0A7S3UJA6_OXYMA